LKRTLILGNLALLVVITLLGHGIWRRNQEAVSYERKVLGNKPMAKVEPVRLPAPVPPAMPQSYNAETVQHFLFSADRNPNVIVKVTPKPPEPIMPALPAAYGLMFFGEPVILLATAQGGQRGYHPGDQVGEFTVVDFDEDKVTFQWRDKTVERTLAELMKMQKTLAKAAPAAAATPGGAPGQGPAAAAPGPQSTQGVPGVAFSPTQRGCQASDNSPAGTVSSDGYKKVLVPGMFGSACSWVKQ